MFILDQANEIVREAKERSSSQALHDKPVRGSGAWYPYCPDCRARLEKTGQMNGCGKRSIGGYTH